MDFKLPDIGEGVAEGEIVKWMVAEGQDVKEDQPMVSVMTDKATVEITAPATGRIGRILAAEGQTVPVGAVIVVIETPEGARSAATAPAAAAPVPHAPPARTPENRPAAVAPPMRGDGGPRLFDVPGLPAGLARTIEVGPSRVLASPAVRSFARKGGLDLGTVAASGPRGRVTAQDVQAALAGIRPRGAEAGAHAPAGASVVAAPASSARAPAPPPAPPPGAREERIPVRGLRRRIAEKMTRSKQIVPHFSYVDEVEMTEVLRLREQIKPLASERGVKLTFLPFVIKALVPALRAFPYLNSSLDDARGEIVLKRYYNIGIATATPEGLTVTVVHDADSRSLLELASEIQSLSDRARAGKSTLEDVTGSTFTITSAGSIGGLMAMPIVNHPEVAILGVFKMQPRPVVREGQIVVRDMMNLSLSLDHRVVDGSVAAEFMNEVLRNLEQPGRILMDLR